MAKAGKCDCEKGAPAWVVTYGDLMSLLLTFFVLLLSFASMEEPKDMQEAMIAIRGAFGLMPESKTLVPFNLQPKTMKRPHRTEQDIARRIRRKMQIQGNEEKVKVEYDAKGGLKISLPSQVLYDAGNAQLRAEALPILRDIGELFSGLPDAIFEVKGHTDDSPLAGAAIYRDNHHLSLDRAAAVTRYISAAGAILMDRFEIVGAGSGQPLAPNTTDAGRQANRRVELHIRGILGQSDYEGVTSRIDQLTNTP